MVKLIESAKNAEMNLVDRVKDKNRAPNYTEGLYFYLVKLHMAIT